MRGPVQDPIDEALAPVAESSVDTDVFEMSLADASVWIEDALNKPALRRRPMHGRLRRAAQWLVVGYLTGVNTGHGGRAGRARSAACVHSLRSCAERDSR